MASGFFRKVALLFDREAGQRMEEDAAESLRRAGEKGSKELEAALQEGGRKASRALTDALTSEYNKTMSKARTDFARGLIDEKEFRRLRVEADRTFNRGLVAGMDRLKASGKATEGELQTLSRRIKIVRADGEQMTNRLTAGLKRAAAAALAFLSFRVLTRFVNDARVAYQEMRKEELLVQQQVQNMGRSWELAETQIRAMTRALWDTHRLTGGEIMQTFRELLVATNDYELAMANIGLVHDIAAATGMEVSAASRLLGRALQGNTAGFARYGIVLDNTRDILEQLRERTEGMALAGTSGADSLTKAWGDFKEELGRALNEMFTIEGRAISLTTVVRYLNDNMAELFATVVALGKALVVVAGLRGVLAVRASFIVANAAAVTFRGTLIGFYALIGPKGWFILAVAALTEGFRRAGSAAREAARDARQAADDFTASVATMDRASLDATAENQRERMRVLTAGIQEETTAIARRNAEIEQMENSHARNLLIGENQSAEARVERSRREKREIEAQYREVLGVIREARTSGPAESLAEDLIKQIGLLRNLRELRGLNATEARQLADAEANLRRQIQSGTLSVEEEVSALRALREERQKRTKDAKDPLEAEIRLLSRAHELGVLTAEGWVRAMQIQLDLRAELSRTNLSLEDRVRLLEQLKSLEVPGLNARAPEVVRPGPSIDDRIRPNHQKTIEENARLWMDQHSLMLWAAEGTAMEVVRTWENAFGMIIQQGATAGEAIAAIGRGMGAALLSGLSDFARGKVMENVAAAIEETAKGLAAAANPATAAMAGGYFAAATQRGAAAAAWGLLSGISSASSGSVGGRRGAGGVQTPRDAGLSAAERAERVGPDIHIRVDGVDPANPRHQDLIYHTGKGAQERHGGTVYINGRRQG